MNLAAVLGPRSARDRVAALATLALESNADVGPCPRYLHGLCDALFAEPPPFGAVVYAEMQAQAVTSGQWTAVALITRAQTGAEQAAQAWQLAATTAVEVRSLLEAHAIDASRNLLVYLDELDAWFPEALDEGFRAELRTLSLDYGAMARPAAVASPGGRDEHLDLNSDPNIDRNIDRTIDLNLADLRAAFQHGMWQAALAGHCPPAAKARASRRLEDGLTAELANVARSAASLEHLLAGQPPDVIAARLRRRLEAFIRRTSEGVIDYSYHLRFGSYP